MTDQPANADDPRRQTLLDAAAELFFLYGYSATSIDAVITKAGGSKRTIYELFGNKQGLFEALVKRNARDIFDGLDAQTGQTETLEMTLVRFAIRFLTIVTKPQAVAVMRLAISEQRHFPALASMFNTFGPKRGEIWLAQVLDRAIERGEVRPIDSKDAAGQFMGILRGNRYFGIVLGTETTPDKDEIEEIARRGTALFLNGILLHG